MEEKSFLASDHITDQIRQTCQTLGVPELASQIGWAWNSRLIKCIGRARFDTKRLEFSTKLFALLQPAGRRDTVIHETCHIVADHKYGRSIGAHGSEWKRLMRLAGGIPKACSKVIPGSEALRAKSTDVPYYCRCRTHMLSAKKSAGVALGSRWKCKLCKAVLQTTPFKPEIQSL